MPQHFSTSGSLIFWLLVLVVIVIIGLVVAVVLKRKLIDDHAPAAGAGFTLSDLRRMVKSGKMTPEEFEKAKLLIIGSPASRQPPDASQPPR